MQFAKNMHLNYHAEHHKNLNLQYFILVTSQNSEIIMKPIDDPLVCRLLL